MAFTRAAGGAALGDRQPAQARHSLSQALGTIRKLGEETGVTLIESDSERVRLLAEAVDADALSFRKDLGSDAAKAAGLYAGPLLDGFAALDAAFDEWLAMERAALHEQACSAMSSAIDQALSKGDRPKAIAAARRWLVLDPCAEPAHRRLMQLHVSAGDRAEAIRQFQACERLLREQLGVSPSSETRNILSEADIARPVRGYSPWSAPGSPAATDEETVKLPGTPSIAVLPFDDLSSDGGQQVLGDGLAEDIISTLAAVPGMRVIARQSTFRYRGARADTRRIAEELNSRYILAGSVRSAGTRVRITAQLIDARDETQLWAERYDREIADIFDVQDEMTKEIVAALRVRLSGDGDALVQARGTKSVEAWKLIVRARATYDKLTARHHLEARALAEQALRLDPEYAYAWSVLGMSYMREGRLGQADYGAALAKAREYTDKAQALDGSLGMALGQSAVLHAATGSPEKAIRESRRAIERFPGDAELRSYASYALAFAGQYDEALDCAEAALDLNPFAPSWYRIVQVRCYALLERYEEAAVLADELLAHEPELVAPSLFLAYSAYCLGQNARARDAVRRLRRHAPHLKAEKIPGFLTIQDTEAVARIVEALRASGLPD